MRITNRVLAVAAALALAAGGLLVTVEIAVAALGHGPWMMPYDDWLASARNSRWESSGPRSLFLALTLAGEILIVLQLMRGRPRSLPLEAGPSRAGLSRRSLEKTLARTAGGQNGVATAGARIRRHRARIVAASLRTPDEVRPRVEEATRARLQELGLDDQLDVTVRVRPHKK
ncbi:MAG: DUF6286 domain-containing protein [Acidimicrobiia bacterium]